MSIESKHAYRFIFLKSDKWQQVRLEALARESGKCQICGEESIYNDAHHIWYPENIYETTERHLVILCRPCHDFVHAMLPDCKTSDEEFGTNEWCRIKNAIVGWRREKAFLFTDSESNPDLTFHFAYHAKASDLRAAYEKLREQHYKLIQKIQNQGVESAKELTPQQEYNCVKHILQKWYEEKSFDRNQ